ncbi:hypothetical protein QQ045_020189 [Rhodiola kirilowii]
MKQRRGKGIEDANSRDNHQTNFDDQLFWTRWIHNDVLVDRIIELPDNAIDCILNRLSLRNIIKTSVLSKNWRLCWTRSSKLEFDSEFYWNIVSDNATSSSLKSKSLDVSQWLTKVTEKGVKEFTLLAYESGCIKISSELFKCSRLERVTLRNCEVICSDNLGNFGNVVYLYLEDVTISDESLELLISKFPLLETLDISFIKHGRGRPFLWTWEHLIIGRPRKLVVPSPPTGSDIDHMRLLALGYKDSWKVEVPLICFNIAEWHYPSRVLRQLGWRQPEQTLPPQSHRDMHMSKRRTSEPIDAEMQAYMSLWDNCAERLVMGESDTDGSYLNAYYTWYYNVTRKRIQPPVDTPEPYRPFGFQLNLLANSNEEVDLPEDNYDVGGPSQVTQVESQRTLTRRVGSRARNALDRCTPGS